MIEPRPKLTFCEVLVLIPSVAKGEWLPRESKEVRPNKRKRSLEVVDLELNLRHALLLYMLDTQRSLVWYILTIRILPANAINNSSPMHFTISITFTSTSCYASCNTKQELAGTMKECIEDVEVDNTYSVRLNVVPLIGWNQYDEYAISPVLSPPNVV